MKPPPNDIRYKYVTVKLTRAQAGVIKRRRIALIQQDIDDLELELKEAQKNLKEATMAPLELERETQIELRPGDPGFDEASPVFRPEAYQGNIKWFED